MAKRKIRTCKGSNLPHPEEVREARSWLFVGAPAGSRDHDAAHCVLVLYHLIEALPAHLPVYCHGSAEQMAEYAKPSLE